MKKEIQVFPIDEDSRYIIKLNGRIDERELAELRHRWKEWWESGDKVLFMHGDMEFIRIGDEEISEPM